MATSMAHNPNSLSTGGDHPIRHPVVSPLGTSPNHSPLISSPARRTHSPIGSSPSRGTHSPIGSSHLSSSPSCRTHSPLGSSPSHRTHSPLGTSPSRHTYLPGYSPQAQWQIIPEGEIVDGKIFNGPQALSPMVPPGEMNQPPLRGMDEASDEFVPFHFYNSDDVIYEESKKRAKIVGGKYLKGELLGEGAYSKVKEMLDVNSLCRRAVKIMKQRRLRRIPNGEANVQREIKILKRLKHRNIVNLIETFEDEEKLKLYVVLDYCVGGLQEMLDKAPNNKFSGWQAHRYFVQLIAGLEYIHSQGVVHKDIKPGNLLLTANEEVKITDFGVAEELDRYHLSDQCQTCQGSPAFQPPEIASGSEDSWSGFKADIWAAGVTLFHFTTGKFPFEGDNVYKLFGAISTGKFEVPGDLSPLLQELIRGMLRKDATDRFSIQQIREHSWFVFKHSRPLSEEIVRFPPYLESDDVFRGTTVLPYLEFFYQYGNEEAVSGPNDRDDGSRNWPSENELFDNQSEAQSLGSIHSADRSVGNIIQRRSRVSSQENVLFPMSKSVDGLRNFDPKVEADTGSSPKASRSRKSKLRRLGSKSSCAQQ